MNKENKALDRAYIKCVILELENLGYRHEQAVETLVRLYRIMCRTTGFEQNPRDFAHEIDELQKIKNRIYDPLNTDHICVRNLKNKINWIKRKAPVKRLSDQT